MAGYDGDFQYYIEIDTDNTKVTADHPDFTLVYDLANITDSDFWANVASDGKDLRVADSNGDTEYPIDVVFIDTSNKKGLIAFGADADTDASQTFRIYYGNSGASAPAEDATYGRENAYASEWKGFWFPVTDPTAGIIDRTSNDNDLTHANMASGNLATGIGGLCDRGVDFNGSDEYLYVNGPTSLQITTTGLYWFAMAYMDAQTHPDMHTIQLDDEYGIDWETNSTKQITNWDNYLGDADEIQPTEWGISAGWNDGGTTGYLGVNDNTVISSTTSNLKDMPDGSPSNANFSLGRHPSRGRYFDGKIVTAGVAQPSISSGFFDDNWRLTMFNMLMNNSTFWTTGTQQDNPNAGAADVAYQRSIQAS